MHPRPRAGCRTVPSTTHRQQAWLQVAELALVPVDAVSSLSLEKEAAARLLAACKRAFTTALLAANDACSASDTASER